MLNDDARYRILKRLQENPDINQRQLAEELGVSLGKINFCLRALIDKGLIKAKNFSKSDNKRGYLYILTPEGLETKAFLTRRFLQRKLAEYDVLKAEIEEIKKEIELGQLADNVQN